MIHYDLICTCHKCGGELTPRATGKPTDGGRRITAIADCEACREEHLLVVQLVTRTTRPAKARCSKSHGFAGGPR